MWKLRYWQPEQERPTVLEVYDDRGIGADLQHAIDNQGCTRVEAVRRGHPAAPKKTPPVKVQRLEWWQDRSYPKGERWEGTVNGELVATVTNLDKMWGGHCSYSLHLGPFGPSHSLVKDVASAKVAAQKAFTKVVRALLVGGN